LFKFYTPEQVAEILQLNHLTILKYIKSKKIKAMKLDRGYRIQESDLKDFIEKCKS